MLFTYGIVLPLLHPTSKYYYIHTVLYISPLTPISHNNNNDNRISRSIFIIEAIAGLIKFARHCSRHVAWDFPGIRVMYCTVVLCDNQVSCRLNSTAHSNPDYNEPAKTLLHSYTFIYEGGWVYEYSNENAVYNRLADSCVFYSALARRFLHALPAL